MSPAFAASAADPFTTTRTTRKVGMGLPLFKLAAEQTGGSFLLVSHQAAFDGDNHGTTVRAVFDTNHVDCEPLGDVASTVTTLIQGSPELEFMYRYRTEAGQKAAFHGGDAPDAGRRSSAQFAGSPRLGKSVSRGRRTGAF